MGTAIGIDLGTTFSAAARVNPATGKPEIIPNAEGESLTPSVVWFGTDPPTVGRDAKAQQKAGASDVASFFKRGMGDPYFVMEQNGRSYTPVDLSALVLGKLKADSEAALGEKVTDAVITVPAYFTNAQREDTIEAGRRAGLNVLRIINEPTAAALAYGVGQFGRDETVLVYDLGGGTFDVTLVRIGPSDVTVLGTDGDHELGGKDWDDRVAQYLGSRFRDEYGFDPLATPESSGELLVRCEDAKRQLSRVASVQVPIDCNGIRGKYELTRDKFEELTRDLLERTAMLCEQALRDARLGWSDLAGALLVGGSSNMPMVAKYVEAMSGKGARGGVPKDLAVALGAAVQAAMDTQARLPAGKKLRIAGERRVQDVMSHSLGMVAEAPDRSRYINSILIAKNKPIPCTETRPYQFRTRGRGDNNLDVYITQGELDDPTKCTMLGLYKFSGITHVQGGPAILDIGYSYDTNGVVQVSATERATGKKLAMTKENVPSDLGWLGQPPAAQQAPVHATVYLVVDVSGSMCGSPLAEAQRAARKFVSESDLAHCSVGVVAFADSTQIVTHACQNARQIDAGIDALPDAPVGGGTSANPIVDARRALRGVDDPRFIVVLTDGEWSQQTEAIREAKGCHSDGIEVVAIGFGGADHNFLRQIASTDEGAMMTSMGGLTEAFGTIATAITEQAGGGPGSLKIKR